MQAKHTIYDILAAAAAVIVPGLLGGCADNPIAPDIDPGEEIPTVAFSVDRGNINEWSRAAEDPFKDWSQLKSIDNRLYPGDFIDKSVDGKPRDPQKADLASDITNGKFNSYLNADGKYHPGWNTDKPNPGDDHKDPYLSYSEIVDLLDESGMPAARMEVKQEPITEALLASLPRPTSSAGESSRGVLVDQKNITERYRHIGVTGICYYNEKDENATDENSNKVAFDDLNSRITIMDNERVTFGGGDLWNTTSSTWFWNELGPDPEINYIRFFAYAPYDEMQDNDWITWYETATGTPSFHYTIPADVNKQIDIAAKAVDAPGDFYRSVPLQFEHLLTGVRFLVDDEYMAKQLQKITIRGVYGEGDYKYSTDPDDVSTPNDDDKYKRGEWTQTGDTVSFVLSRDNGDFLVKPVLDELDKDGDRWCITDADHTLLMLPQVLPKDAIVIFEFDDPEQPVLYGKLDFKEVTDGSTDGPQHEWKPGYIVTYFIQTFDIKYVLKLVKDGGKYPYSGGYDDFTVISYAVYYTKGNAESASKFVKIVPVPWEPVFYDQAGNAIKKPDWVKVTYDRPPRPDGEKDEYLPNSEYIDGDDPRKFEEKLALHGHVDVSALDVMAKAPHYAALRNAPEVGTAENPVDLSGGAAGSPRNTANCYIINGPGYYSFPLVYGNAYKDGSINTPAYTSTQGSFQTHTDRAISSLPTPWIKEAGKIKDAALISTNAINAVQLVNLTDDYLTIYVEPYFIDQGNTTLCVRDDKGDIMWSWHIWTTDYNPYIQSNLRTIHTERNNQTETFDFMTIDLGYHYPDAASGSAGERSVMWRPIQQCRHRGDVIIRTTSNFYHILQEGTETTLGYAPYYNWGRKDPLLKSVHTAPDDEIFFYKYSTSYYFATYSLRRLYDNTALTSYKWSLDRGHYYFWQPTPAESVLVPWAMLTFRRAGSDNGSTNNNYYNTWWKGTSENITNPGPVPVKDGETWPSSTPHGYQSNLHRIDKYYHDLWCADQGADVNYLNAATDPRNVVKTVFDPCPPGFCVPPNRAFDRININYSIKRKHPELGKEGYMQIRSDLSIGYTFYISPEAADADDMSDAATINFPAAAWISDRSRDDDGHWCLPWLSAYMNQNCSLWTADISMISAGKTYIGSIFNITDMFLPSQLAGSMDGTGGTAQNCTDVGARSTSFLSSSGGRHVRAVKEK